MRSRILIALFLLTIVTPLAAQRRVAADVETKTVVGGKVITVTKTVYYTNNGRMVTRFHTPEDYWTVTTAKGELQAWFPATNEVLTSIEPDISSRLDLIALFLSGHIDDLGLSYYNYRVTASERDEEGYVKKTFVSPDPSRPVVHIVYENYLPIYCDYTDAGGKVLSKKYLSSYKDHGRFLFPTRITDITYGQKRDSTVARTLYSSVRIDTDDDAFGFQVPADAKPIHLQEAPKR